MNIKTLKILLIVPGITMALVSTAASAMLWTSYTNTALDQAMAMASSISLTALTFIFVIAHEKLLAHGKKALAHCITVALIILLAISAAASMAWLESRYQQDTLDNNTGSAAYIAQQQRLQSITASIASLQQQIDKDLAGGKHGSRVSANLEKISAMDSERAALIKQIENPTSSAAKNSGSQLASDLGSARYALWGTLALLIDGIPILCFATAARLGTTPPKNAAHSANLAGQKTQLTTLEKITQEINSGHWGEKPAMRQIMEAHSIRHDEAQTIFNHLIQTGLIRREGQRFIRTGATV